MVDSFYVIGMGDGRARAQAVVAKPWREEVGGE